MSASPHFVQSTAGIGTPQTRWREMHQSGRFATMLYMRSCPHDGIQCTLLSMASSAASRSVLRLSPEPSALCDHRFAIEPMNHCDVARKITGLWQRQQCGYVVRERFAVPERAALPCSASSTFGIRVEHTLAAEQLHGVEEVSGRSDRRVDLQAVAACRC